MATKLRIDISQGVIDIEGDPDLVREIYTDFKSRLLEALKFTPPAASTPASATHSGNNEEAASSAPKQKVKRRGATKKKTNGDESGSGVAADAPKLDKNLDTSGLGAFYSQFAPKNNAEKILIFLKFMADSLNLENPNTDQVYTCFKATGDKIPKAFAQAFYDTSSKFGYIDFRSPTDFPVTIAGDNHFNHKLKRNPAE
ncbi:hypothetical protein [Sphingosinicella microcystinivorans]|uniref:Uncharacterized protein n=1 Tax=Sphingosinicella microcystinivorans TaxID=335406 RepID=A0AAD1D2L9_SPHMI|nr:hypothetical protein [Sphingosinicella microcystinivorans]RKS88982.1 hypothetical protein DFR51_2195 [Sphingosinicella microcystinivorans]BBE32737.1 hypothetical protein SmB9_03950 [Sphingosinicella microcystinivorans]